MQESSAEYFEVIGHRVGAIEGLVFLHVLFPLPRTSGPEQLLEGAADVLRDRCFAAAAHRAAQARVCTHPMLGRKRSVREGPAATSSGSSCTPASAR